MGSHRCKPDRRVIYRPWRRCPRTGRKIWAHWYGLKAWPIPVDDDGRPTE